MGWGVGGERYDWLAQHSLLGKTDLTVRLVIGE